MFERYSRRINALPIIEALLYDAVDGVGGTVYKEYNNVDIYDIMKVNDWTQEEVDELLKECYDFNFLTPYCLKQCTRALFDGVKLKNVKINDWDNISFVVKYTESNFLNWLDRNFVNHTIKEKDISVYEE